MTNYTYRKLQTNEFHLLVPLMKDSFGVEVNVKYFEWKFVNNPAGFVEGSGDGSGVAANGSGEGSAQATP
jgi:hypothetical protein